MSDREEIRWKLSNIQQVLAISREEHEKEQENFQRTWDDLHEQLIRARNTVVGGIGFGVLLVISLISIDNLSEDFIWIIPVAIVIALVIFLSMNGILKLQADKYYKLDDEYQKQVLELIEFESWFIGYSLREDITSENIMFSLHFVTAFAQAVSYDIKMAVHKIFDADKPNPLEFKISYDEIKPNLEDLKALNLKAVTRLENFYNALESKNIEK